MPEIPADVRTAIVGAYYPRALAVSDGARSRAQAAYGVASAIAAALVAAGVFGDLGERSTLVQVLGVAALVGWLAAAWMFLVALSAPFYATPLPAEGIEKFVNAVLAAASAERSKVDRWSKWARRTSVLAGVLTVLALSFAVFTDPPSDAEAATITLTSEGAGALSETCTALAKRFEGRLAPADLEKEFVSITLETDLECGANGAVVSIPRAQVRGVVFTP